MSNPYLNNHGTYWSVGEMKKLAHMVEVDKMGFHRIAWVLKREPSACADRYRLIRISTLFTQGNPEDTLKSFFAKDKEIS